MEDGYLFEIKEDSLDAILRRNAEDGILFYSVSQCSKLLKISECQVRYAIEMYRLDSLFLAGEYRIPYTAMLRFHGSGWLETSIGYLNAHKDVDIEGVYDLNFKGEIGHVVRSLNEKRIPLEAIPLLLGKDKRVSYDELPGEEAEKSDWYDLDELQLPLRALVMDYAALLATKPEWLCMKLSEIDRKRVCMSDEVSYPEIFDIMIENEYVNYPIPVVLDFFYPSSRKSDDVQPELF